jgi:elongation factor Tu
VFFAYVLAVISLFNCCFFVVRELLNFYKFPGDDTSIVKGSALAAATGGDVKLGRDAILELMAAVEEKIPTPLRETDKPYLMPVEDVFSIAGRGTVVTGRIEMGVVKVGDELEVVGLKNTIKTTCTGKKWIKHVCDFFRWACAYFKTPCLT